VLASRLAEDANRTILVIEAGGSPTTDPNIEVPIFADIVRNSDEFNWRYTTVPQKHACKAHVNQVRMHAWACTGMHGHAWTGTPRAGCGVVRINPLRFLAGCHTRRLNQAVSVSCSALSLSLDFLNVYFDANYGPFLLCVVLCYLYVPSLGCSC